MIDTKYFPPLRASTAEAIADLETLGCCSIAHAVASDRLERLRTTLDRCSNEDREASNAWFANGNQRVWALPGRDDIWLNLVVDELALDVATAVLGPDAILSSMTANIAMPGNRPQSLHADQGYMREPWPWPATVNVVWALDDFTPDNGGTRVVPGSHRIGCGPPDLDLPTVSVNVPAGSLLCIDGRVWHGTGANLTDRIRRGVFAYYCSPFLRQQENAIRSLPADVRGRLSPLQSRVLGFDIWEGLGTVNGLPQGWMGTGRRSGPIDPGCAPAGADRSR